MAGPKETHTHSVIPKKLWQALTESSVQHFDAGGEAQPQAQPAFQQAPGLGNQNMGTANTGYNTDGAAQNDSNFWAQVNPAGDKIGASQNAVSNPGQAVSNMGASLGQGVNGLGGMMKDAAAAFTSLNDYQANAPNISQQNFAPQVGRLQGQQAQTYVQQQNLANQLLQQSRGAGPNPAQAQLAQNTGQNVAQQNALMAGQRGASSNVGLMARQAAQQGSAIQQNATGQAASLQAQQQLAAQNALAGVYGNLANQSLQGESIQQGGQAAQNTAVTSGQLGAQQINANISGQNAAALNGTAGGISNALGGGLANSLAKGGVVKGYADGGIAQYSAPTTPDIQLRDWKNQGLQFEIPLKKKKDEKPEDETSIPEQEISSQEIKTYPGSKQYLTPMGYDDGGEVEPSPLMGIQDYTTSKSANGGGAGNVPNSGISAAAPGGGGGGGMLSGVMALLARGGPVPTANFIQGGPVSGHAKVSGDSPKNDTVPAMVSPGEIVLPRSVTQGPNMEKKVIEFLRHLKKPKGGYEGVVNSRKAKGGRG